MCRAAAWASGDPQPRGMGGKSTPPWAGTAGAAHPHCPASAAQGWHQQLGPPPVLPIPSWGRQCLCSLLCTSPSSMNHCTPAFLLHPSFSSDPCPPDTVLWVSFKATGIRHRSWHRSATGTAGPGDCLPAPAPQAAVEQGVRQDSTPPGQCPDPTLRPGSSQIRTLGASHWGTARSTRSPPLPGWLPHPVPAAHTPQEQQPRNLPGGKARLLPALLFPWGCHSPSAGAGCPGQPSLVPQHRHRDGLQNRRKRAQTSSSCHSSSCCSLWSSACGCCLAAALPAAQRAGRARKCQPLAAEQTAHGEGGCHWAELTQSLHGSRAGTPHRPGLPAKPWGPARLCTAAWGLMGTARPVETRLQCPVPLNPGSWAWDPAPQRDGQCCQQLGAG